MSSKLINYCFFTLFALICLSIILVGVVREVKGNRKVKPAIGTIKGFVGGTVLEKRVEVWDERDTVYVVAIRQKKDSWILSEVRVYKHEFDQIEVGEVIK